MKAAQLAILTIAILALMNWSRGEYSFRLPTTLPLLGGQVPSIYDVAAAMVIVIALAGLMRLGRRRRDS